MYYDNALWAGSICSMLKTALDCYYNAPWRDTACCIQSTVIYYDNALWAGSICSMLKTALDC